MDPAKLLVIDDDQSLNNQLTTLLRNRSFDVQQQFDGEQGLLCAVQKKFDLILLDAMLPDRDGFSVLHHVRNNSNTPVIMLMNDGTEAERIKGLSIGADDCLPKPFNPEELMLRIDAILRRTGVIQSPVKSQLEIHTNGLKLNKRTQSTYYSDREITLTPTQFKLLWMLVSNPNEILSKAFLYKTILEREFILYDRSLDMHMSRVRKKLEQAGMPKDRLKTIHGTGYCFS
ncbi:response regulator receiver-modulated signal transduction transcriptional regulator [Oleiphilus messinensis]|uniref:Response regulator receiver-modulated signal transduction transcriptional regulator n=1 Tax=Oleiphilus messinensis TaxID=141451 RepID=A0A1Y0I5F2_9GAMM|nr:response regulator transcription factor [Oleiphilus messinensis]ARU54633.1 response regulator receiver-modulated signal transduction transcriptional regulator [Oleiphilus messinensis]